MNNMTQRAGAALAAKLKELKGARGDMYFAGYTPVSASSAKLLIGFNGQLGAPELNHVTAFVNKLTGGALETHLNSVNTHSNGRKSGLTVVVSSHRQTLPESAKHEMIAVSSTMFMDTKINANWEIKAGHDGHKYLECNRSENIPELLNMAIASQGVLSAPITFSDVAQATVAVNKGDFVEFYADGGLHRGDVTKLSGDEVAILADDRQWLVDRAAVTKVLRINPKAQEEQSKEQEAFYATIWGKEFAKALTRSPKA